jgi:putative DNA primase/helicase
MEIESRATVFATGNGLRVRGDMTRRTLVGSLDAQMERPELRSFKTDPVAEVLADRGRYVGACLTIVRAYLRAGSPNPRPTIASFGDWSALVRSALVWLGCDDPVASMEAAREDDADLCDLREVLLEGGSGFSFTVRALAEEASRRIPSVMGEPSDFARPELRDVLLRIAGDRSAISTRRLARWLMDHEGRIVSNLKVVRSGKAQGGAQRWSISSVGTVGWVG